MRESVLKMLERLGALMGRLYKEVVLSARFRPAASDGLLGLEALVTRWALQPLARENG